MPIAPALTFTQDEVLNHLADHFTVQGQLMAYRNLEMDALHKAGELYAQEKDEEAQRMREQAKGFNGRAKAMEQILAANNEQYMQAHDQFYASVFAPDK